MLNLSSKIELQGVPSDSIMAYADDLLIVCSSILQLNNVIRIVKQWCCKNNFKLNESKSGIVELLPRKGPYRPQFKDGDSFQGISFTSKYRYLGTWITSKFKLGTQLDHIKRKTDFLAAKLFPLLHDVSLSLRINLWKVFIKPLFDQLIHLFLFDKAKSNQEKANRVMKYTFKRFTLLTKNTPDRIIYLLARFNLQDRAKYVCNRDENKWKDRLSLDKHQEPEVIASFPKFNAIFPKELQTFINLSRSLCKTHKFAILNPSHLCSHHGIEMPSYEDIIWNLESMVVYKTILKGDKSKHVVDKTSSLSVARSYLNKLINGLRQV